MTVGDRVRYVGRGHYQLTGKVGTVQAVAKSGFLFVRFVTTREVFVKLDPKEVTEA